jgi:hypothetical protein
MSANISREKIDRQIDGFIKEVKDLEYVPKDKFLRILRQVIAYLRENKEIVSDAEEGEIESLTQGEKGIIALYKRKMRELSESDRKKLYIHLTSLQFMLNAQVFNEKGNQYPKVEYKKDENGNSIVDTESEGYKAWDEWKDDHFYAFWEKEIVPILAGEEEKEEELWEKKTEEKDISEIDIKNLTKEQVEGELAEYIEKFEKENEGKNAIYGGNVTKQFKEWLKEQI